jgi:phage-related tail fiber protein
MPLPIGTVVPFSGPVDASRNYETEGWYLCDGRSLTSDKYPLLSGVLGTSYGGGSGSFNLPDYRGMFLRGQDQGAGHDPEVGARYLQGNAGTQVGDVVGSWQVDALGTHSHHLTGCWGVTHDGGSDYQAKSSDPGSDGGAGSTDSAGSGAENRPKNVNVNYLILGDVPST